MGGNRTRHEFRQSQPGFPAQAESLVNTYFALIDEMATRWSAAA
jgi:hypothetical protein